MWAKISKIVTLGTLFALGSCAPKWHGQLIVDSPMEQKWAVQSAAETVLNDLTQCGYQLPNAIMIKVKDLNPGGGKGHYVLCGLGTLSGSVIKIDDRDFWFGPGKQCSRYEDTIAHEVLHLMGFRHETAEHSKEFAKRLRDCGFYPIGT